MPRGGFVQKNGEYSVGGLAKKSGLPTATIVYYVNEGLLRPSRTTPGGHRRFNHAALITLQQIKDLKKKRLTIEEIKTHLTGGVQSGT